MDPILVRSYQLCIFQGKQAELPPYGQVKIKSFLYQGKLRPIAQTADYHIISEAEPFIIPAIVQYAKTGPLTVSISAKGVIGEERVYEERVHVKRVPRVGDILQAEVVALPSGRLELEAEYQDVLHT